MIDLTTLYTREHPRLVRLLTRLTGNPTEAEDLAQETFLRALRAWPTVILWEPHNRRPEGRPV